MTVLALGAECSWPRMEVCMARPQEEARQPDASSKIAVTRAAARFSTWHRHRQLQNQRSPLEMKPWFIASLAGATDRVLQVP